MKITKQKNRMECRNELRKVTFGAMLVSALFTLDSQASAITADFNGDGYQDLIVGVTGEDFSGLTNAGAVKVVYGNASGRLEYSNKKDYIHQGKYGEPGIQLYGVAEANEYFGSELVTGDFNNDGYDDVAAGVPRESSGNKTHAGLINIIYGSADGLKQQGNHMLSLQSYKYGKYNGSYRNFGRSLAVGDYDGDGVDDLAANFAGGYHDQKWVRGGTIILFGDATRGLKYSMSSQKAHVVLEPWQYIPQYGTFGSQMISGDFNNDGKSDLALGSPTDRVGGVRTGSVSIAYGVADWNDNPPSLLKIEPVFKESNGHFGASLAVGNFNSGAGDELIIGQPGASTSGERESGNVLLVRFGYGDTPTQQLINQDKALIPGKSLPLDRFGQTLTVADFNGDGKDDLAIGIPSKSKLSLWSHRQILDYGEIAVLYNNGWTFYKGEIWNQDSTGVAGGREKEDYFASSLTAGDFNNDGISDILIGARGEDLGSIRNAGSVQLIWGAGNGLTASLPGKQFFHQGSFSGEGFGSSENESYDSFGQLLD